MPCAVIDLDALVHNYQCVRELVGDGTEILAMVKADAYGHGAAPVALALARSGCRAFGVATLDEAEDLAPVLGRVAPDARTMVLAGILPEEACRAVALGCEIGTQEPSVVEALARAATAAGREVAVHVKVDTGMSRLGAHPEAAVDLVGLLERTPGVRPAALFSHFAQAESVSGEVTRGQLELLAEVRRRLGDAGIELPCHLANSAGVLTRPESYLDGVRPGLMLYGLYPDRALTDRTELRPVMRLEARVVRVADIEPGRGVSYGHTFRTSRPSRIATLRCGYADGYPRALSNSGEVGVGDGVTAPVVGRVCMDHTMIDVTDAGPVALGDTVELWGNCPSAERMAERAGTISYELVARVGKRVPRRYTGRYADSGPEVPGEPKQ